MRINTNVASLNAQEAANLTNSRMQSALEKLSSGLRINKASDDASGLAIADKLRTQATSINQGIDNGNSAIALLQIADKSMAEQSNILDSVKAKLIQANTATTSTAGRNAIAADIAKLMTQFENIAKSTNYNGTDLISTNATDLDFQVGESSSNNKITLSAVKSQLANYTGISSLNSLSAITAASAGTLEGLVDTAINDLNKKRGSIGSVQNQVDSAVRNLMTQATNVKAAESIIRDVDYAKESANFNKQNIIAQAGAYAISQANAAQQNVLRLLQ
ncbi:MAG: flagellin [Candidatus Marinarcus sp.]|uniref:flagellin n=1 Tax=Candidatus Marinarcus sp. TaxID=3100987 RepID=UPI003AFFA0DE